MHFLIFVTGCLILGKIEAEEEWNGGRPPPFFPQGMERPIPRYAPTFSRYTPFLTEDTLPKPIYGHPSNAHSTPPSIYKAAQGRPFSREMERNSGGEEEEFPFRRPPYSPGMFQGGPPRREQQHPEPFKGPRGETEEEAPPPFLPPQYRGQRIPPPQYFAAQKEGGSEGGRPFFGPIHSYSNPENHHQQRPKLPEVPTPKPSNYSASPEYGSEVQISKEKSRPERLFAVKPPEFPAIPSPPPYPSPAPFTPSYKRPSYPEATTRPSPSIYSPLQGPFPEATTTSSYLPASGAAASSPAAASGKPKPNGLPQSFRSFFPPGFGPFADGKIQRI